MDRSDTASRRTLIEGPAPSAAQADPSMRDPRELMLALDDVVSAVERNRLAVSRAALGLLAGQARTAIQRCTAELTDDEYRLVLGFLRQTVIEFLHVPEPRAGDHRAATRGTPTRSQPGPGSPPGWEGHSQSLTGECC